MPVRNGMKRTRIGMMIAWTFLQKQIIARRPGVSCRIGRDRLYRWVHRRPTPMQLLPQLEWCARLWTIPGARRHTFCIFFCIICGFGSTIISNHGSCSLKFLQMRFAFGPVVAVQQERRKVGRQTVRHCNNGCLHCWTNLSITTTPHMINMFCHPLRAELFARWLRAHW